MTGPTGSVLVDQAGPAHVLTLNDPDRRNAIGLEMRHQLVEALAAADADVECRAVILTGAEGHFSAGGDLSTMSAEAGAARMRLHAIADVIRAVVGCSKPVIAAVDGAAFGAGLSLASACDVVVASPEARFCCAFSGVGLTADAGLHWSLPARVGYGRARMMIMLGRVVDAEVALSYGLVDEISPGPSIDVASALAAEFARRAPLSLAHTKAILATNASGLDEVLARESVAQQQLLGTADFAEGRQAFFERRSPDFRGE